MSYLCWPCALGYGTIYGEWLDCQDPSRTLTLRPPISPAVKSSSGRGGHLWAPAPFHAGILTDLVLSDDHSCSEFMTSAVVLPCSEDTCIAWSFPPGAPTVFPLVLPRWSGGLGGRGVMEMSRCGSAPRNTVYLHLTGREFLHKLLSTPQRNFSDEVHELHYQSVGTE